MAVRILFHDRMSHLKAVDFSTERNRVSTDVVCLSRRI